MYLYIQLGIFYEYIYNVYIYIVIKDELPLDIRVIGTLVNSFFEYS
jgi:hypothetical protein